ncbi:MAG: hypothetical protein OXB96_01895 [Candidatus Kaiserbacteria bacterium]|nr:hypothetical protein [Candidatus Kaiserbacteria bacterium]
MNKRKRGGRRERGTTTALRMPNSERRVPVENPDRNKKQKEEKQDTTRKQEELGAEVFFEKHGSKIYIKPQGFFRIREKWDAARKEYAKGGREVEHLLKQFPKWVRNIHNLPETLKPLIQNEESDHEDFLYFLQKQGFINPENIEQFLEKESEEAKQEACIEKELQEMERKRAEEEEKKERAEMLKRKILEELTETYFVQPKEVYITEHPPYASPNIVRIDRDKWGKEMPEWGRIQDIATTTRSIYTEAVIVGDAVHIMDINQYGTGLDAIDAFAADHEGGKFVTLHFYEKGETVRETRTATRFKETHSSLIIHDPEAHISGKE